MVKNGTSIKLIKIHKMEIIKIDQNCKSQNVKSQNCVKILRLLPPMSISALKPGPVVPPGTQKVPNQAARISQSVDFGHLSDILAILRGGHFFTLFCHFYDFHFYHFITFSFSAFCHFLCFSDFGNFGVFWFWSFLLIFVTFSCCWLILVTFCCQIRCLNYDTLFF